jgi:hypothetical protein
MLGFKKRNMVDEEEMEETDTTEEVEGDEEQDIVDSKNNKQAQVKQTAKKVLENISAEQPKVQLVEREITLSLLNDKLNFIIAQLTDKQ